jgi:hypothetical protein
VESAPAEWQRFTRPGFGLELDYPLETPLGHAAELTEERAQDHRGDLERFHFTSPGGELYVEVTRFRGLSPADEHSSHSAYLERRFGPGSVTALTETALGEREAWTYGFHWESGERSVLLLELEGDTYRVIHDPRSELNARVLATIRPCA